MSIQKQDYFARQSALPEIGPSGLQRLQSAKIAVVGTGGVGSAAAYFLASLGIGQLTLIDQDLVEESNLHRFIGADQGDLYQPKAEVLGRKLNARHPWTRTEAIVETLRTENCDELLHETDLIVDGTDNLRARDILNKFSVENNIPYLFTSAIANQGHLSLFNPPATPCLECLMPTSPAAPTDSCETLGVTSAAVGLIGTLAASEAAKRLLGLPTGILGQLLTIDLAGPEFLFTKIAKRENCAACTGSRSESVQHDTVVMLCGDNVANILPQKELSLDLQSLNTKVPKESIVASSNSVFVYTRQPYRVSVFKTGRLLIGNVSTEETARQVASEVWNEIL
jgi:molybdopterin/thiamine biosynthesis adenylyltransferase